MQNNCLNTRMLWHWRPYSSGSRLLEDNKANMWLGREKCCVLWPPALPCSSLWCFIYASCIICVLCTNFVICIVFMLSVRINYLCYLYELCYLCYIWVHIWKGLKKSPHLILLIPNFDIHYHRNKIFRNSDYLWKKVAFGCVDKIMWNHKCIWKLKLSHPSKISTFVWNLNSLKN